MFVLGQTLVDVRCACAMKMIIINTTFCKKVFRYARNSIIQYAWLIIHTTATCIAGRKLFAMLFKNDGGFLILSILMQAIGSRRATSPSNILCRQYSTNGGV